MERLNSPTLKQNFKHCVDAWSDDLLRKEYWRLYDRLAAYEDTGLTPDEILDPVEMAKVAIALKENARLREQLTEVTAERDAAVELVRTIETMVNDSAEWFDMQAQEWGESMDRFRGDPGEEHRFRMALHIRDAYRKGQEKFDMTGAKIDNWRGLRKGADNANG